MHHYDHHERQRSREPDPRMSDYDRSGSRYQERDPRGHHRDPRDSLRDSRDPRDSMRDSRDPRDPRDRSSRGSRHMESEMPPQIPPQLASSDPDKAQLIMQVLQLTDAQIALLPADQRASILELKKQIAHK